MKFSFAVILFLAVATVVTSASMSAANAQRCSFISMRNESGVITIYNDTRIRLNYEIRALQEGEWSDWKSNSVRAYAAGTGWSYHAVPNAETIQIRFDRIGGDDEFTEKIYNLKFNWVAAGKNICRHKGRSYKFEFDRGGKLLDLYRHGW